MFRFLFKKKQDKIAVSKKNGFELLPTEITHYIFSFLNPRELSKASPTCRQFYHHTMSHEFGLFQINAAYKEENAKELNNKLYKYFRYDVLKSFKDKDYTLIKILLSRGAHLRHRSFYLQKVLHFYYQMDKVKDHVLADRYMKLILLLLDHRVNLHSKYPPDGKMIHLRGKTALDYAKEHPNELTIIELLKQYKNHHRANKMS